MQSLSTAIRRPAAWALTVTLWVLACGCQSSGPGALSSGTDEAPRLADTAAPRKVDGHLVGEEQLREMGLRCYWQIPLPLIEGDAVREARLFGEQLVVQTRLNMVYAVDANTGESRPLAQVDLPTRTGLFAPTYDGTRFFFAGKAEVIGLNARTLEVDVNIALALPASCPAVSDRTFVFTGALDGKLFAYNIASQVLHWKSKVASAVTGLGVLNGNVIVCRSNVKQGRGELVAYRPGQKFWSEIWPHPVFTEGPVSAPIVVSDADQAIYVASEDRSLYKFNAVDGWVDWRCRTPGILRESPTLLANGVVQRIPGSGTWLVNRTGPDGGKPLWKDPGDLQYLGQAGQRIYFFDGRSLLCKDAATGKTLKSAEVRGAEAVISAPNPDQPRLYLVNQAGQVFCANDLNLPYLTPDMLR